MKRKLILTSIILILLTILFSCGLEPMEEGRSVTEYIFPYINFTLSEDGSYYTAEIVEGAAVSSVYISAVADYFDDSVPVLKFEGFVDPADAVNLKSITFESSQTSFTSDIFIYAENLEKINIVGAKDEDALSKLPDHLTVTGKHFHRWNITDNGAEAVMYELIHHERKDPTCTEDGNIEYWECPDCGKLFLDTAAGKETTKDKVLIKALGHKFPLIKVEESESTCLTHGYKEHWYCERCGELFWDAEGTEKATQDEVTKPFAPHKWDEGWQSDEEYHWHVCENGCGTTTEKEIHREVMNYNKKYHWYECSVCGRHLSGNEAHTFDEKGEYCTKCGYVYDNTDSSPGFDVEPVYEDPTGEISSSYDKTLNKWTFTLVPTNKKSLPIGWEWYVDGEAVEGADTATFEFIPPSEESYVIFCMFWNDKGAGSSEVNI